MDSKSASQTAARVAQVIDHLFGVPADALHDAVLLQDGLQLDSLSVVELQVAMEDTFGIRFTDDASTTVTTFGELVSAVEALGGAQDEVRSA